MRVLSNGGGMWAPKKSPTPYRKVDVNARDLAGCCGGGHDHRNRWSHHRNEWSRCRNQKNQIENIGWSRSPESVVTIIGIRKSDFAYDVLAYARQMAERRNIHVLRQEGHRAAIRAR